MNLLAIDTSTDYLSLAVMKDGKITARFHRMAKMAHSKLLVPTIDKILKKAGLGIGDIDCFAVSLGPGSFTGLRIGVSVVKGLAFSLGKRIIGVPTLDAIALNAADYNGLICPVLDARKNKVYACIYRSDGKNIKRISEYLLLPMAELQKRLKNIKEKVLYLGDMVYSKNWYPKAEIVARIGFEAYQKKEFTKAEGLEPMYLYSKECDITGL